MPKDYVIDRCDTCAGIWWVKLRLQIRNNKTSEIVETDETGIFDEYTQEASTFIWSEGNFKCDCNRQLFFNRAKGEPDEDVECGEGKFSVNLFTTNGRLIYKEFD